MKKIILFIFIMSLSAISFAQTSQRVLTVNEAVRKAVLEVNSLASYKARIAIVDFNSSNRRFSDLIVGEITTALVNSARLTPIEYMDFHNDIALDPRSIRRIGQDLRLNLIITGSLEQMGGYYRLTLKTIKVDSMEILASFSANVKIDAQPYPPNANNRMPRGKYGVYR